MARILVCIYFFFVLSSYLAYAQDDNETISTTTPTTTTTTSEPQGNQEQETETAEEVQGRSLQNSSANRRRATSCGLSNCHISNRLTLCHFVTL